MPPRRHILFSGVMTVMFNGIYQDDKQNRIKHRIPGTTYDEVLYADDIICVPTNTMALNKLLALVEEERGKHVLEQNKTKNDVMYNSTKASVHFRDGTELPSKVSTIQH